MAVQQPQPAPAPVVYGPVSLRRVLLVVAVVLFALAAFAAGGDALGNIPAWSFGFGAFGAYVLAWAVP